MARALYRKYRSKSLAEVVGQAHITDILARSLAQGQVSHAYLLTGPRGVGKTSIARILAHEINKLPYDGETNHLDIIEIDAASNSGVDNIRDLRDKTHIAPVSADKKVYIIDEVHMLSKSAFNALLKTLEEPPEHVVFILATTDVDKLPETIISRTQRFSFRAIARQDAVTHLASIAKAEGIKIDEAALELIATLGDGSFRDSISLLDQLSSLGDVAGGITAELIESTLGLAPQAVVEQLIKSIDEHKPADIITALNEAEQSGVQTSILTNQLIESIRKEIATKPHFVSLLDSLLEVQNSPRPDLKLLTTLLLFTNPKPATHAPKTAALEATMPSISAPIAELEKQAVSEHPEMPAKPEIKPFPPIDLANFDWQALIDHCRTNCVAVYSVLSKCGHELDGQTLRIYTGNAFYKKKIDNGKHRVDLIDALTAIGAAGLVIETIPASQAPKDSKAAAVAAIMGGGEEVSVDL